MSLEHLTLLHIQEMRTNDLYVNGLHHHLPEKIKICKYPALSSVLAHLMPLEDHASQRPRQITVHLTACLQPYIQPLNIAITINLTMMRHQ